MTNPNANNEANMDNTDDNEALVFDEHDVQITRWLDMSPIERAEQQELAKAEREEYEANNYVGSKVAYSRGPQAWVLERRQESPLAWSQRHLPALQGFIDTHVQGLATLSEPYMRLASLRGDSIAYERALIALAYAMGSEGSEVSALQEVSEA